MLQETRQKIITDAECQLAKGLYRLYDKKTKLCYDIWKDLLNRIEDYNLCGESAGSSVCKGDSGGPYTVKKDHQHYLAGVTSWGSGCAEVSTRN